MPAQTVTDVTQYGAFGIVGTAFVILLKWLITKHDQSLKELVMSLRAQTAAILTLQSAFLRHDMSTTVLANLTPDQVTEGTREAITKYQEIQRDIEAQRFAVLGSIRNYTPPPTT